METPHHGNASKTDLKNKAHRSGGGEVWHYTGDCHFISMGLYVHIINKSYCFEQLFYDFE